jgi:hypothetical protein
VRVIVSVHCPLADGAKTRLMEHVALTMLAGAVQPLVRLESPAFAPPRKTEKMCNVAAPELVTVTLCGPLVVSCVMVGKGTPVGVSVAEGFLDSGVEPVPLR